MATATSTSHDASGLCACRFACDGRTEWNFVEQVVPGAVPEAHVKLRASGSTSPPAHAAPLDLVELVRQLPTGIGVKKAVAVLQAHAPEGYTISTRQVRAALDRAAAEAQRDECHERATPTSGFDAFDLCAVAGKGMGGFAKRAYKRGECILAEEPLLQWSVDAGAPITHDDVNHRVASLGHSLQDAFWSLCQNEEYGRTKSPYGIWLSNAFPTDGLNDGTDQSSRRCSAVFEGYCRLNHSCDPNVHGAWNPLIGRQTMYATRAIEIHEELTVSYLGVVGQPRSERRAALSANFSFSCSCQRCGLSGRALSVSDQRQARIHALKGKIVAAVNENALQDKINFALRRGGAASQRTLGLALIEERIILMEQEGMGALVWETQWAAREHCERIGDKTGARRWAQRAAESARHALGVQSEEFERYSRAA
jgi:hypothetical protein